MSAWIELQSTRHQVAICGQVSDAQSGVVIPGVLVQIVQMPEAFKKLLVLRSKQYGPNWEAIKGRLDMVLTAVDGYFYFLDLPAGEYTLSASLPSAGTRYGTAQVTAIVSSDSQGNISKSAANITLPPTAIKGQIVDTDQSPIVMGKIQIEGTSNYTFTDSKGNYLLSDLETSKPPLKRLVNVKVYGRGFQPASQSVNLSQGEVQTLNFNLAKN